METNFKEEQKFTQWWIWGLLIGITIIPIYGINQQILHGEPFGDKPMSDTGLIIFLISMLSLLVLFWMFKLTTVITHKEIKMRFSPFSTKIIQWSEIESATIVNYGFVGGWGIRLSMKYGIVYNIAGNTGLAIVPKKGKKFLIGTQKVDDLRRVMDKNLLDESARSESPERDSV